MSKWNDVEHIFDDRGNAVSTRLYENEDAALEALNSNRSCSDCVDCAYCVFCSDCVDCTHCSCSSDCSCISDNIDALINEAHRLEEPPLSFDECFEWWHILDTHTNKIVKESELYPYGGGYCDGEREVVVYE